MNNTVYRHRLTDTGKVGVVFLVLSFLISSAVSYIEFGRVSPATLLAAPSAIGFFCSFIAVVGALMLFAGREYYPLETQKDRP